MSGMFVLRHSVKVQNKQAEHTPADLGDFWLQRQNQPDNPRMETEDCSA